MKKNFFLFSTIFFLIAIIPSSIDGQYFTVQSVVELLIPYPYKSTALSTFLFLMNFAFTLTMLYEIISKVDNIFNLELYILSRINKSNFHYFISESVMLSSLKLTLLFQLSTMVFLSNNTQTIEIVILLCISLFLTLNIWGNFLIFFKLLGLTMKQSYFSLICLVMFMQVLSKQIPIFSLLIVSSINFFDNILMLFLLKLIFLILLIFLTLLVNKNYEPIGD